jgi:hypothetical protein
LKNGVSGRDPSLHGFWKCSHIFEYAALSKTPCASAGSLILVFQQPDSKSKRFKFRRPHPGDEEAFKAEGQRPVMPLPVMIVVLLAALLHASWNFLVNNRSGT